MEQSFFSLGKEMASASFNPSWESRPSGTADLKNTGELAWFVSTPHGRAVPLELKANTAAAVGCSSFQPLMGEPSLWNTSVGGSRRMAMWFQPLMGEPSLWNGNGDGYAESYPHGFNPSWESRPSGTAGLEWYSLLRRWFQPLMGEPSLWNPLSGVYPGIIVKFQPLMGEPSLWNYARKFHKRSVIFWFQPLMGEPSLWNPDIHELKGE